jgi:N-acetylglucosamine kinase-like BadF-type ATPase
MNYKTLIADSGSTKTDWLIGSKRVNTQGITPIHQDDDTILAILNNELLPQLNNPNSQRALATNGAQEQSTINRIRFYGAGVRPEQEVRICKLLKKVFPNAVSIEAKNDMLGAARALCGKHEGLACILGTGANSCLFDGQKIVENTPPLGYILGDEGSGAVMGRLFINALYKSRLYKGAQEEFEHYFSISMADIIERVYRQPMANRWLASLCPYIREHLEQPSVHDLVVNNFRLFIRHNLVPYQRPHLPINAVGSVAFFFSSQLAQAAAAEGYTIGKILRSPLDAAEWL